MRKRNFLGAVIAVALVACMMLATVSSAFAADQMTLSVSPDKTTASVGDTVTYTYVVTSNSTDNITNLALSDNSLGSVSLPSAILLPGENVTATRSHVVTVADLPGPFGNTATATGTLKTGDNVTTSASASLAINPLNPGIRIVKSADVSSAAVGDNITYTYIITNSGSSLLGGLALNDSKLGAITLSTTSLLAGANATATKTYTVVSADLPGPLKNIATVTATDPSGATVTASSSEVSVALTSVAPNSSIAIVKNADLSSAAVGDNITYTYAIANTGNTTLNGLVLIDSRLGAIALSTTSLTAGQNFTTTRTYKVVAADLPGPLTNTATVTAVDTSNVAVSATSSAVSITLTTGRPVRSAIRVTKKTDKLFAQVGDNITYTYSIRNIGSTKLTGLTLTDSKLGVIILPATSLDAGANITATSVYIVVQANLPGPLSSVAKAAAADPSGATVSAMSNKVTIRLIRNWDGGSDNRTKGEILKDRGVPGKGIDNAPGLQKFFNFWSNIFNHGDKNDKNDRNDKNDNRSNGRGNGNGNGNGHGGDKHDD